VALRRAVIVASDFRVGCSLLGVTVSADERRIVRMAAKLGTPRHQPEPGASGRLLRRRWKAAAVDRVASRCERERRATEPACAELNSRRLLIQQLLEAEAFGDSLVPAALRPVPFKNADGSEVVDLYLDRELFPEAFADVDSETAVVMAATQRPWSGAAAATPSGPPGWRSIPSWYLLGTEDRAIPPAGQRFMAERGNARIEEVAASHASMVSQPEPVTRLILSRRADEPESALAGRVP
jgi:pimeloyl-ACP methyl ester carboxylesterase